MVARPPGPVKPTGSSPRRRLRTPRAAGLTALCLLAGVMVGDAEAKRARETVEFSESGVVDRDAVDVSVDVGRFELGEAAEAACLADLATGHLGLGNLADVFVEGPAGVRINLLSGNLVWHRTFLPHGSPRTVLALPVTYNSSSSADGGLNSRITGELSAGWSMGYGQWMRPGPFGVMEVVEADGFVHRFHTPGEGEPLRRRAMVDALVERRRQTGAPRGADVPSGRAFRRRLESDAEFLAAIRAQFFGGPTGQAGRYVSEARGHQVLEVADDGTGVRVRADGTADRFDASGRLTAVSPPVGADVSVEREPERIGTVRVTQGPALAFDWGGGGVLDQVSGAAHRHVRFGRTQGQLTEIQAPEGRWAFEYDEATGRLVGVAGPYDSVRVEYDDTGRRVAALHGPDGTTRFTYSLEATRLDGTAEGPAGRFDVRFDLAARERTVSGPTGTSTVRFDGGANKVMAIDALRLEYDLAGHVVGVRGPAGWLEVRTDDADRPVGIVTPGGGEVALSTDDGGLLTGAADPSGVSVQYLYDRGGLLQRETGARGAVSLGRDLWGQLNRVAHSGGDDLTLRRDGAGRIVAASRLGADNLILQWDDAGRLTWAGSGGGAEVRLHRGDDGSLMAEDGAGGVVSFLRATSSRVRKLERTPAHAKLTLGYDPDGLLTEMSSATGLRMAATRQVGSLTALTGGAGGDLRFDHDEWGLATAADGLGRWRFERDPATGRTTRVDGAGGLDLRLAWDEVGRLDGATRTPRPAFRTVFDAAGRPQMFDPAGGATMALHRDAFGRVVEVHRGEESVLRLRRDLRGRVVAIATGKGEPWWLSVERDGWPGRLSSPDGRTWTLSADGGGRVTLARWPGESTADFSWDGRGGLVSASWPTGRWHLLYGENGRLARTEALLGGLVEYSSGAGALQVRRGARLDRQVDLDAHGRFVRTLGGDGRPVDEVRRGSHGELQGWSGREVELEVLGDAVGRPVRLTDAGPEAAVLDIGYGVDGLLGDWRVGELSDVLLRDGLGRVTDGSYPVLPASSPLSPLFRPAWNAPPSGALGGALIRAYLNPPWARGGGGTAWAPDSREPGLGPALPRWAVDRLWADEDEAWLAALPEPPAAAVSVPAAAAPVRVTIPGALALLGFLPDDLSEHRVVDCLPAPVLTVALPGADELRMLRQVVQGEQGAARLVGVSIDPFGRGVVLHPDPPPAGHATPWAAVADPFGLQHPASELLGLAAVIPAPGAADPRPRRFSDADPAAERLRYALDTGRWWSAPRPSAVQPLCGQRAVAGALSAWTVARIQVVVDTRGRLRGLDLGSTATAAWNRAVFEAFLGAALEGMPPPNLDGFAPIWAPIPGAAPESALGLVPGPGRVWPDRTGTARLTW